MAGIRQPGRGIRRILFTLALCLALMGCTPPSGDDPALIPTDRDEIIQDGISIPKFSTAAGQLNYARSQFRDKKRKSAAFRAVAELFPDNRPRAAQAALGLAYLHLEPDYRFAKPLEILKAVNDFKSVLESYPDLEDVSAKAHWYLGWIHTTLDRQPEAGRQHFRAIIRNYADTPMNLRPPEPWVNLAQPQEFPRIKQSSPVKYWAQAALLELVRCPDSTEEAVWAFDQLYDRFFSSTDTGVALKLMLARPALAAHVGDKAAHWTAQNGVNPYLTRQINALARTTHP